MPWSTIASVASNLVGGLLGKSSADKANAGQVAQARRNEQLQREFAQKGIQWKVDDARAAGVHPLYALGASTHSFAPQSVGHVSDPFPQAVADSGQDISRAIAAGSSSSSRVYQKSVEALTLRRMGLENELLVNRIAAARQPVIPGNPSGARYIPGLEGQGSATVLTDPSGSPVTPINMGGGTVIPHPGWSDVEYAQQRYGEPAEWLLALPTAIADLLHTAKIRNRGKRGLATQWSREGR